MDAVMSKSDEDLREKIKTFIVKMDKMEARVKEVEAVASAVPKLAKKIETVETRVDSAERSIGKATGGAGASSPFPVKAFVGGASISFLIIGAIVTGWLLGFF
jgi:hypothetical protein